MQEKIKDSLRKLYGPSKPAAPQTLRKVVERLLVTNSDEDSDIDCAFPTLKGCKGLLFSGIGERCPILFCDEGSGVACAPPRLRACGV